MGHYRYFLAIQTRLPEDYLKDAEFRRNLETLRRLGFDGVELNIQDPERVEPARLKAFLAEFGLVLSMFASGLTAKTFQLSLAASDEARRRETIGRTARFLEFAHEFGAGVIAGFLKGAPQENGPGARERLAASVLELAPVADRLKTPLLIEAVNRYESPVGHSLADTWDIARRAGSPFVQILPDTFHMNIEEVNMRQAIARSTGPASAPSTSRTTPGTSPASGPSISPRSSGCSTNWATRASWPSRGTCGQVSLRTWRRRCSCLGPLLAR